MEIIHILKRPFDRMSRQFRIDKTPICMLQNLLQNIYKNVT